MSRHVIHAHSSKIMNGKPMLPSSGRIEFGELAVNYSNGNETIALKNENNEIVEFKSDKYYENKFKNISDEVIIGDSLIGEPDIFIDTTDNSGEVYTKPQMDTILAEINRRLDNLEKISGGGVA